MCKLCASFRLPPLWTAHFQLLFHLASSTCHRCFRCPIFYSGSSPPRVPVSNSVKYTITTTMTAKSALTQCIWKNASQPSVSRHHLCRICFYEPIYRLGAWMQFVDEIQPTLNTRFDNLFYVAQPRNSQPTTTWCINLGAFWHKICYVPDFDAQTGLGPAGLHYSMM